MKFNTLHTEEFIEHFYDDLLDAYNAGEVSQCLVAEMCRDAGVPEWNTESIWATEIRDYFEDQAEQQYYRHLESLNG